MGWTYNVVDPNVATNAPIVAGVGIFFTILSLLVVSLRIYVRKCIVKAITVDDWLIVATWFLAFIFVCITLAREIFSDPNPRTLLTARKKQDGVSGYKKSRTCRLKTFMNSDWWANILLFNMRIIADDQKLQYAGAPFYICGILGFKLSIIFAFLRIAVDRTYRIGIICVAITCSVYYFCFFVAQLNFCAPVAKAWDPTITIGSCLPAVPFYTAMGSITFIFDILTMLTPIPILMHSCFSLRKNILIALLFLLGIFLSLIQILRITTLRSQPSYLSTSTLLTWSLIEVHLGIILSSLIPLSSFPTFQSFLDKGSPQSLARSLASFDTRKTMEKVRDGWKRRFGSGGRRGEWRDRIMLFLGYGELRPDLERETSGRSGSRLGTSTEELNFPMGILKTTEVIVSREGSSWGELKEEDV
ncbi:uncharacterized protein PAC_09868 [Phialocephala subalpina]|uniref:Rhodopsin domain-containing protein n=1 Tax=Phialocephala subalpina TaxID=576137 RepID=A0A1L7X4M1_9HELO|nr:uncharacterized protein PAC_09868 [Phialocephala subalpina]